MANIRWEARKNSGLSFVVFGTEEVAEGDGEGEEYHCSEDYEIGAKEMLHLFC